MSILKLSDKSVAGNLNAYFNSVEVNRLTINGQEVTLLNNPAGILTMIEQIQAKIAELDTFCKALSEAIYIAPKSGETGEITYPSSDTS
jgi:hypothetical protein